MSCCCNIVCNVPFTATNRDKFLRWIHLNSCSNNSDNAWFARWKVKDYPVEDVTDSSSDESQSIDHNEEDSEAAASSVAQHGIVDYPLQKEGCDQSPTTKSFQQQQDYTMEDKQMIHESDVSRSDSESDEEIEECFAYFLEEDQENN
ncbi:hypothetical protein ONE63_011211 [Megalurothrips usitatus]|uniref:Uncharacterized protein n=1 Tax=Megalurothrips usitatus TaxID=439358 RepID=A0AAV7X334_9NEOP|nr:hypothetical protein ONE63_011211 [Megalurothrips usitatus]